MEFSDKGREEFWSRVNRGDDDDCWLWVGGSTQGYGVFFIEGERHYAHRYALSLRVGELGDDWALHKCDNPPCVNPTHLYRGDNQDNMRDASERTDYPSYNTGEESGNAILTEEDAIEIINEYNDTDVTQSELADEYGVSQMQISRIVRGERWGHLQEENSED